MRKNITVCITAVGGGGFGEQILKALRHACTPYRILGTDAASESAGFAMADITAAVPPAGDPDYLDTMLALCRTHQVTALLPGSEAELLALSAQRHRLAAENIFFPAAPHSLLELCLDKCALFDFLASKEVDVPWHKRIRCTEDLCHAAPYPLIFKPSTGSGGSTDVFIAQDEGEALLFGAYLLKNHAEFIAQAYVGTPDDEYTVGVLKDMAGGTIHAMALHRTLRPALSRRMRVVNRTGRAELGSHLVISSGISQGRTGVWPEICRQCEDIADQLGARGPFNLQCRFVDGRVRLFEINPRFSGTSSIRAMVGFNEPDMLIRRHVLGEDIPRRFAVHERTILRRLEEVMVDA